MSRRPLRAWLRCSEGCDFRAGLTEVVHRCHGQGPRAVERDVAAGPPPASRTLFDEGLRTGRWPYGLGVWGARRRGYPGLRVKSAVSRCEGASPLWRFDRYAPRNRARGAVAGGVRLTHAGSIEDLGMTVLPSRGTPIEAVPWASTGDASGPAVPCAEALIPAFLRVRLEPPRGSLVRSLAAPARAAVRCQAHSDAGAKQSRCDGESVPVRQPRPGGPQKEGP